jgi:heme-degrading monooxygenase HmoA
MPKPTMIARIWRGATNADDAEQYLHYLERTGLAEYAATPGHRRTLTLRRIVAGRAEFLLLSLWDSMEAVRSFAGEDPERAVFYPEDDRYLVERDEHVTHFDVVHRQPQSL